MEVYLPLNTACDHFPIECEKNETKPLLGTAFLKGREAHTLVSLDLELLNKKSDCAVGPSRQALCPHTERKPQAKPRLPVLSQIHT